MTLRVSSCVLMDTVLLIAAVCIVNIAWCVTARTSESLSIGILLDVKSVHLRRQIEGKMAEKNKNNHIYLHPNIVTVDITDSFAVSNAMCDLITQDVVAILGVTNTSSLSTVQSYSNTFQMPFLSIGSTHNFSSAPGFQLYVRPSFMGAVVDLLHHYGCRKAVYIYDSDEGLMRIQDLFQSLNTRDLLIDLDVRRVNSLPVAKDILSTVLEGEFSGKDKKSRKVFSIMDLDHFSVMDIISHLINEERKRKTELNVITVSLDLLSLISSADLSLANISGFQLVSDTDPFSGAQDVGSVGDTKSTDALLSDSLDILRSAVDKVEKKYPGWLKRQNNHPSTTRVKCTNFVVDKTPHGDLLMRHLKKVQMKGHTGVIKFDENGKRCNFTIDVLESRQGSPYTKAGKWHPEFGMSMRTEDRMEKTVILLVNKTKPVNFVRDREM